MARKQTPDPVAELNKRIDQLAEDNKRLNNLALSLMATPATGHVTQQQPQPDVPALDVDLSGLPDPSQDPEGYTKALRDRMNKAISTNVQATINREMSTRDQRAAQQRAAQERYDRLWAKFNATNPELADATDIVEIVGRAAVNDMINRGLDVDRAIFADEDGFIKDVAGRAKQRLAALGWKPKAAPKTGEPERDARQLTMPNIGEPDNDAGGADDGAEPDDAADRTGGLASSAGGTFSGGPADAGSKRERQTTELHDELTTLQRKSGFF